MDDPRIETLFFDAAGTLFHVREPVGKTYAEIGCRHGITLKASEAEAAFKRAWKRAPRLAYPADSDLKERDGIDRVWWRALVHDTVCLSQKSLLRPSDRFEAYFRELYEYYAQPSSWVLFPEALEILENSKTNYFTAVLSNFDSRLEALAEGLGITRRVHAIYYSARLGAVKPDPAIFRAALRAAGARPGCTLHVGDDPARDDRGARRAGLRSVLLDRRKQDLRQALDFLVSPRY